MHDERGVVGRKGDSPNGEELRIPATAYQAPQGKPKGNFGERKMGGKAATFEEPRKTRKRIWNAASPSHQGKGKTAEDSGKT